MLRPLLIVCQSVCLKKQKELLVLVKFGLNQLISMEPEMIVPAIINGQVAKHCNHMVSCPDKNNNIVVVYSHLLTWCSLVLWGIC